MAEASVCLADDIVAAGGGLCAQHNTGSQARNKAHKGQWYER